MRKITKIAEFQAQTKKSGDEIKKVLEAHGYLVATYQDEGYNLYFDVLTEQEETNGANSQVL